MKTEVTSHSDSSPEEREKWKLSWKIYFSTESQREIEMDKMENDEII